MKRDGCAAYAWWRADGWEEHQAEAGKDGPLWHSVAVPAARGYFRC
jgi:hypothetical protein